jgi:hypothetical protein
MILNFLHFNFPILLQNVLWNVAHRARHTFCQYENIFIKRTIFSAINIHTFKKFCFKRETVYVLKKSRVNRDYDGSVGNTSLNIAVKETYLNPLQVIGKLIVKWSNI